MLVDPKIYVACLASYNAGTLHGAWIDCDLGLDHIEEEVQKILAGSPEPGAEEFAIHDHEGFPCGVVGEYSSLDEVAKLAEIIEQHGEAPLYYMTYTGCDLDDLVNQFQDHFEGEFESRKKFVEYWIDERLDVPEHLEEFICEDKVENSLFCGDFFSIMDDGCVYIFRSC